MGLWLKVRVAQGPCQLVLITSHYQVNDEIKQRGVTSDMIFPIPRLIKHVSSIMSLSVSEREAPHRCTLLTSSRPRQEGDLIMTGTPSGVGPLKGEDKVSVGLTYPGLDGQELEKLEWKCEDRKDGYEFSGN